LDWKGKAMMSGEEIEALSQSMEGPFPYKDCRWLIDTLQIPPDSFIIPDLDVYLSDIEGYSSWASRLVQRPRPELESARAYLSKNCFQRYPSLEIIRGHIDEEHTPELHRYLKVAETLRVALVELLTETLRNN
jgi:hypothetical protein